MELLKNSTDIEKSRKSHNFAFDSAKFEFSWDFSCSFSRHQQQEKQIEIEDIQFNFSFSFAAVGWASGYKSFVK